MTALLDADADYIRTFVRQRAAIVLDESKGYLIETRLTPLAKSHGMTDISGLVSALRLSKGGADLQADVVDALTTNETSFFRDRHPFEALRNDILPPILRARAASRSLTIWSGACSTGQEAYSIAMVLRTHFPTLADWKIRIVGFDLSRAVLEKARSASYTQLEVNRGLPAAMMVAHMTREGASFKVKPDVAAMCEFHQRNLLDPMTSLPTADVVFLRNVLIYFDGATKKQIIESVAPRLAPDGALLLGAAESTLGVTDAFERVSTGPFSWYTHRSQGPLT